MGTSNAKTLNLQDSFLNKVRAEKKTIVIYLLNGFQVRGKVWGFDNFTVIIDCDGRQEFPRFPWDRRQGPGRCLPSSFPRAVPFPHNQGCS